MNRLLQGALRLTLCCVCAGAIAAQHNVPFSSVVEASSSVSVKSQHYGDAPNQFVEVIEPPAEVVATVLFVHGGCWLDAYGVDHARATLEALASRGFRAVAPEYTRIGEAPSTWPQPLTDLNQSIDWALSVYPDQPVWLVGHSAGGHLALLASEQRNSQILGVVGLAPIVDLQAYSGVDNSCASVTERLVPEGSAPETFYSEWSPVNRQSHRNTKLFVGSADVIVESSQRTELFATHEVPRAGHFDFIMPGTEAFEAWVEWLESETP